MHRPSFRRAEIDTLAPAMVSWGKGDEIVSVPLRVITAT
jgi:hypothetical protein